MKDEYDFSLAERGRFLRRDAVHSLPADRSRYAVVIEKTATGYSAYVPDLPGCVATGETVEDVEGDIRSAIRFHLDGLRSDGITPPAPTSLVEYVDA